MPQEETSRLVGLLSLVSLVGFITLAGISVRNGILKVSHYINRMRFEHLVSEPQSNSALPTSHFPLHPLKGSS